MMKSENELAAFSFQLAAEKDGGSDRLTAES